MAANWLPVNAVPAKYYDGRDMILCFMPGGRQLVGRWDAAEQAWMTTFGRVEPTHVLPTDLPPGAPAATQLPAIPPDEPETR